MDPEYFKSLVWILGHDITDVLDLAFTAERDYFGKVEVSALGWGVVCASLGLLASCRRGHITVAVPQCGTGDRQPRAVHQRMPANIYPSPPPHFLLPSKPSSPPPPHSLLRWWSWCLAGASCA